MLSPLNRAAACTEAWAVEQLGASDPHLHGQGLLEEDDTVAR
jgi:hypothetical protein